MKKGHAILIGFIRAIHEENVRIGTSQGVLLCSSKQDMCKAVINNLCLHKPSIFCSLKLLYDHLYWESAIKGIKAVNGTLIIDILAGKDSSRLYSTN